MHLSINPYNWQKVNHEFLYGKTRLELIDIVVNDLSNGNSFGITGGRRMGKTTLLRRIESELLKYSQRVKSGGLLVIPVYIETLMVSLPITSDKLYQEIARSLNIGLSRQSIDIISFSQVVDSLTFREYLCEIIESVTTYRLQIVVIFDEIELISKSEWGRSFFANWRSLLTNTPEIQQYLSAVFSGADEMFKISRDVGSPLGNALNWQELELLSLEDTSNLMCEPVQYNWSKSFIEQVYDLTGGHPFLIQYLMQIVCNSGIDDSFQSLEKAKNHFLKNQRFQFQNWWEKFDDQTRALYSRLTQISPTFRTAIITEFGMSIDRSISILSHTGVVSFKWENGNISTAGSLFKDWFNQFGDLSVPPDLASRVDELLKVLERQFRLILSNHFDKKSSNWLQTHFTKNNPAKLQKILKTSKKPEGSSLNNNEILKNSELGDTFELIILKTEWNDLSTYFRALSEDKKIAKSRFEERKDHLVPIRNKLRHVREDEIELTSLLKAQAFCVELLESLSSVVDQDNSVV